MIYWELFWSFFQIGLLSIGGGYAALPIIQNMVVDTRQWLTMAEFADLVVITEMTPGPIILNSATFVGTQVGGSLGAIAATLGCIAGPSILVSILAHFYFRYKKLPVVQSILAALRPAVVALIASAGVSILLLTFGGGDGASPDSRSDNVLSVALFLLTIAIIRKYKPNPILAMIGCGILGGVLFSFL